MKNRRLLLFVRVKIFTRKSKRTKNIIKIMNFRILPQVIISVNISVILQQFTKDCKIIYLIHILETIITCIYYR
jgi:hypothetical protein